jgi:hypothetical protein
VGRLLLLLAWGRREAQGEERREAARAERESEREREIGGAIALFFS